MVRIEVYVEGRRGVFMVNRGGPSASSVYSTVTCTSVGGEASRGIGCVPGHTKRVGRRARCILGHFNVRPPKCLSGVKARVGSVSVHVDPRTSGDVSLGGT